MTQGSCQVDIRKNRMLQYPPYLVAREAHLVWLAHPRDTRDERHFTIFLEASMEMFGRVGLVEIPVLIAPDQKVWMDKMIKEGKIAVPPGGTLEKGSLYSMFIRMLLHNAMEEQKRQEALEADDEDDE
jgi:hypothetical protein